MLQTTRMTRMMTSMTRISSRMSRERVHYIVHSQDLLYTHFGYEQGGPSTSHILIANGATEGELMCDDKCPWRSLTNLSLDVHTLGFFSSTCARLPSSNLSIT